MIFSKIESRAEETLSKFRISTVPVPIEEIASRLNIKISRAPSKVFSGLLIRKDGHALIGVNNSEAPVRQRFTVAHEIGHFLLHPRQDTFVDYRNNKKDVMRTTRERRADMFAAALLMPRKQLEKDFKKNIKEGIWEDEFKEIFKQLADQYFVSEDAMRFRISNLNLHLS